LSRIFEPYWQVQKTRTGMGLPVYRQNDNRGSRRKNLGDKFRRPRHDFSFYVTRIGRQAGKLADSA
jgi:hypothetical protein